ncbi:MAG: AAA domain-containing protein [Ktedonobacterales bacterium]
MTLDRNLPFRAMPQPAGSVGVATKGGNDVTMQNSHVQAMLSEMDVAIADEIAEIERYNRRQRIATNGQLISEAGGHFTYSFSLDEPWEPEDDTPVTIKLQNSSSIRASIVTASGTTLTLTTEVSISPEDLSRIYLTDDPTQLLERLRETLRSTTDSSSQLSAKAFGFLPFSSSRLTTSDIYPNFTPRPSQMDAIQLALGSEVAYIIGPPGTGKTSTLAAVAYTFIRNGRSVLIAAHTNIAVDNAILKLADMCHAAGVPVLSKGQIIRYGTPQLQTVSQRDDIYPPKIVKRLGQDFEQQRSELRASHSRITDRLQALSQQREALSTKWENVLRTLSSGRQSCHDELGSLKLGEQQRIAAIDSSLEQVMRAIAVPARRLQIARETLAQLIARKSSLEAIYSQHSASINDLYARLAAAQQMGSVMRLLKGVNVDRLAKQIAEIKQHMWQGEHDMSTVTQRMEVAHHDISTSQQEVQHFHHQREELLRQRQTPLQVQQRLADLETKVAYYDQQIIMGDEQLKRDTKGLLDEENNLRSTSEQLTQQLAKVEELLRDLEKRLMEEAHVVATTLSKVYMDKRLNERRFDVVIVDEVSMAPLPALYMAGCHADRTVLAIGDPQQLAPIVQAKTPTAKKWLGRSLFDVASISVASAARGDSRSSLLREQSRMHPRISAIARKHVYENLIQDVPSQPSGMHSALQPLPATPLLLCDTSDGAPVTSRPGGRSRINLYHAFCSVAIARQALESLPNLPADRGHPFRIGIVTPYRKQAELIQRMIKGEGLERTVRVGTVHRFQGLEYEVIIFDTVESPPFKQRTEFISGGHGSEGQRLINVAVTRSQHKLIVVANSRHILAQFEPNDTLYLAMKEAQQAGIIKSRDVLKSSGFAQLERQSHPGAQPGAPGLLPTTIEWISDADFFARFLADMRNATSSISIFSPFVRQTRTATLIPHVQKKCAEGVRITVVASSSDQANQPVDKEARELLERAGVDFRTSPGMHEKAVIIDEAIAYFGSLNPLSHNATTEVMQRVASRWYATQLSDAVRINERAVAAEWGDDILIPYLHLPSGGTCPVCGGNLEPRLGKYGPFYGCSGYRTGCKHTSDVIEAQLLQIPALAHIRCDKCNAEPMRPRVQRKDVWAECATDRCDYRRKIVFIR